MAAPSLKQRVEALEAEVACLKAKVEGPACDARPWWDKIAGTFANDPIYEEAMRLGREWRESFRPKPRKRRKR
jgi:hypothetical protein